VCVCVCVVCVCVWCVCACVCFWSGSRPTTDRPTAIDRPRPSDRPSDRTGPEKGGRRNGRSPLESAAATALALPPRRFGQSSHCLQWPPAGEGRFSDPPAGAKCGVLRLPLGVPDHPPIRSPCAVFSSKMSLLRSPGGVVLGQYPLRRHPKTRSFLQCALRPLKNTTLLPSEIRKTRENTRFRFAKTRKTSYKAYRNHNFRILVTPRRPRPSNS
jgi:hypothetical protein